MSSSTSTPLVLKGNEFANSSVFVNCIVPSGQVLIEVETDSGSGVYNTLSTVTTPQMFHYHCPNAQVNTRITPSGGATVIIPAL